MIIECIKCSKIFDVNSELIPQSGRLMQCGSCNHVWFFDPNKIPNKKINDISPIHNKNNKKIVKKDFKKKIFEKKEISNNERYRSKNALVKYKGESKFTLSKFLSYIVVMIISFIAVIVILDTFKTPLENYFPNLELILFNLFESINDIKLFIKDLI
tara:strand:+ start:566 stop:1036 length:471 start_codon:yes stop_codon:yes gene_type:complete